MMVGRRLIGIALIALMAVGSVVLWLGIPVGVLYLASRLVKSSQPSMGPYVLIIVGIPLLMIVVGKLLSRLNRLYGDVLVEPQPLLSPTPAIPGSDGRKMSKSLDNAIGVRDDPDTIRAKVRTFITDPQKVRRGDPGRPEICPIFALHRIFSEDILEWTETNCRTGALGCVDCKNNLADRIIERFRPFRERRAELEKEPGLVATVLAQGAAKVRPVVEETMAAVRAAMHFR